MASKTLFGLVSPSPLPSAAYAAHVDGMNCIGPTARSHVVSWSYRPPSVSRMAAMPGPPLSTGPRIGCTVVPAASTRPPRAWPDSMRPMPASSDQCRLQPGVVAARRFAAFMYASSMTPGMPSLPATVSPSSPSNGPRSSRKSDGSAASASSAALSSSASGSRPFTPSALESLMLPSTSPRPGGTASMSELPETLTQSTAEVVCSRTGASIAHVAVAANPHCRGVSVA